MIQQAPPKRRGLRLGCLIVGIIVIAVLGVGGYLVWNFVNDEVLPGLEGTSDVFGPVSESPPGPCYDIQADDGVLTGWDEVSCDGPRQVEVSFAALFEDGPFPGDQHLVDSATNTCLTAFENYVGVSPDESIYDVDWMVPTEELWASGVHNGICLVVADDGSALTGTIKGSNR
jgi:Septum formation